MSPRRAVKITMVALVCGAGVPLAHGQKIYWNDPHPVSLKRADLDGSNIELLVNLLPTVEAPEPTGGLALDLVGNNIYWTAGGPRVYGEIQRANLDGSNVEVVLGGCPDCS